MTATRLVNTSNITLRLSGAILIDNVLPYCKEELLTSEVHEEFTKAFKKDSNSIVKYNQLALKYFLARVLNLDYQKDFLQSVIEMCVTRSIIVDCEL